MAKRSGGFKKIPSGFWLLFVRRSLEDQKPNEFNDVCYLMNGTNSVDNFTCTTVPGLPALKGGYKKYNKKGAAVLKSNIWMYDSFKKGLHNGRMKCLRQDKDLWAYRDGDNDNKAEQLGQATLGMWHTNIHTVSYKRFTDYIKKFIGGWSYGCIVFNNLDEYYRMLSFFYDDPVTALIIDEFTV